jgi:tetratricopeptide (TPR) repeat protein
MAWWGFIPKNIGFDKGKEFAQKALSINNNLGEAHATLGGIITWQEWNWKEAEKELKYAITLNPHNATIHQYYCELLNILGRNIEAREQINLALELNPYSVIMNRVSSFIYYNNFEFQKAIKGYQTTLDLADGNNIIIKNAKLSIICSYLNLDKNKEAIDQIKKFISIDPSYDDHELLDKIYNKSGIKGVVYWFIDWLLESKERKYRSKVTIAKLYSCIGDYQNTLKYLESASENKEMGIPGINNISDFKPIKNEPRFQAILKKMNLTD